LQAKLPAKSTANQVGAIGLDIRASCLNMVQMSMKGEGSMPTIRAVVSLPLPCDREELLASPKVLKKLISGALKEHGFLGKRCISTLPANKISIRNMSFELKTEHEDDMQALYPRLRELLGDKLNSSVIDYIPIRPENKKQLSRSALVAITERSDVDTYLNLIDQCGLEVDVLEVGPLAIRRLVAGMSPDDHNSKLLVMNVGETKSYLTVIWGRRILLDKEVPFGRNSIISALVKELTITESAAERLLSKYGFDTACDDEANAQADEVDHLDMVRMLGEIVTPIVTELGGKIREVLLYTAAETHGGGIDSIYLMGSIAHFKGVDTLLSRILSERIDVINPFYGFKGDGKQQHSVSNNVDVSSIAVATGMSLRGLIDA